VHVFVRDWLSANNILLRSPDEPVLIDSGYVRHAPLTLALLASPQGLGQQPLARLVNTHCHSDHMGGNAAIKTRYRCPIALPEGEVPLISAWDEQTLLLGYCDQRADRFSIDEVIKAGETHVWGGLEWRALAAPGHDMGALVFYNPEHRVLISGDALWRVATALSCREIDPSALPATRATLEMLARLDVRVVIRPWRAVHGCCRSLDRAFKRASASSSRQRPRRTSAHSLCRCSRCSTSSACASPTCRRTLDTVGVS
jgi:glyoxylase-like metal-dependent hydrolase (beta-lactamase superfamily II)